eukprot:TRINITY_DN138_c0_g2_i2.p3 TRINITY_DN138_c0_g2~~TRINITY_DN138_c0_g2_i2.p3  ORF type:complete len:331 (-),score=-53.30 TRINITY_DN138_c0_g2_i2:6152-7144(-)
MTVFECLFVSLINIFQVLAVTVPLLIAVAYLTLAERKVLAAIQKRKGPNVVGLVGLLQPFSDGAKLILKESVFPFTASKGVFAGAPILTFALAILGWVVIPFDFGVVVTDINLGLFYLFAVSSLGVYGIITAGWASNSRYAFLGALRSAAQMVSYEVSFGLILINLLLCVGSLNLTSIVLFQKNIWFIVPFFPLFFMFLVSILAETNRPPFDLPEAEAELVAGYNVEYSAVGFALFFIGEYANIILMSTVGALFFFGGWLSAPFFNNIIGDGVWWLGVKSVFIIFIFVWVRAALPRFRYDQLMRIGWKVLLPLSIAWVVVTASILVSFAI